MAMCKTTDTALIYVLEKDLRPCQKAISQITSAKWSLAYSRRRGILLIRRRAGAKQNKRPAEDLESSLAKVVPELPKKLVWAWTSRGEQRYFPTGELLVLFDEQISEAERKKILGQIKGVSVRTCPNITRKLRVKCARQGLPNKYPVRGFSPARAKLALEALRKARQKMPEQHAPELPTDLCVPVASISLPDSRRNEIFEMSAQIAALPHVLAVTPDFNVLGKRIKGEPQQGPIPPTSPMSVHKRNLVDLAWIFTDPSDLSAPVGQFIASREQVAVLDWVFFDHPDITYDLKGYDAADQDRDPRTPEYGGRPHGTWVSGVIGGLGHGNMNAVGMAPGAVIIPVRPSWATEDDFDDEGFYRDYEEFVERFTASWINAIIRLWELSHSGVEVANMSFALNPYLWQDSGVAAWMDWWLRTGNNGYGVFAAASAGNNPALNYIACPANTQRVFSVGVGNLAAGTMLGNTGYGLDIIADEGKCPIYQENGQIEVVEGGGSSVASAVVAATVAMMKRLNPNLTADKIKTILQLTTRKAPGQAAIEDITGYCTKFGWGFLNAYYAIDVVWRKGCPAAELLCLKYDPGQQAARVMIQLRQGPRSSYAGKRSGMFWVLFYHPWNPGEQRWVHDRDPQLRNIDQAVDTWGMPFGEFTVVGDFDGDGLDEIALQLEANEFWPQFTNDPAHSFLVSKYDAASKKWNALGGRSPYASGLASPQIVFPPDHPIHGVITAVLKGNRKQCLVAWQDNVVNVLQYDAAADAFLRLNPVNFTPQVLNAAIHVATGISNVYNRRIIQAVNIGPIGSKDAVLFVASFSKGDWWPGYRHYLTVFVMAYDATTSQWTHVPLSSDANDTHLLVDQVEVPVEAVLRGTFSSHNPVHPQIVIHTSDNRLYYVTLHRRRVSDASFSGYAIYKHDIGALAGRVSRLRVGSFGIGPPSLAQLAWLSDLEHGNQIHFIRWDDAWRVWRESSVVVSHGRKDNEAIDFAVLRRAAFMGGALTTDAIALLMKLPDANTFKTYRWFSGSGRFEEIGVL